MASKKKTVEHLPKGTNREDILQITSEWSPDEAYAELSERGYDNAAIGSFAAAQRSWSEKGSPIRLVWEGVEKLVKEKAG